jgi:hypothetical protein
VILSSIFGKTLRAINIARTVGVRYNLKIQIIRLYLKYQLRERNLMLII